MKNCEVIKIIEHFLKKTPIYVRLLIYTVFVISTVLCFWLMTGDESYGFAMGTAEIMSGISFFVSVALLIIHMPSFGAKIKNISLSVLKCNSVTGALVDNPRLRLIVTSIPAIIGNIIIAAYNAYVFKYSLSSWFGTFAAYYFVIAAMRIYNDFIILSAKIKYGELDTIRDKISKAYSKRLLIINGICFIVLTGFIVGTGIMLRMDVGTKEYPIKYIYYIALYTFIKVIVAIINISTVKKYQSHFMSIMRQIGMSDALVSIYMLQVAMINAFGEKAFATRMNTASGIAISVIVMAFGIWNIHAGARKI